MQTSVPATIERIRQLPIPDDFKPVLMEAVAHVLQHPERFDAAAEGINADVAAKCKPDNDGSTHPPVFWLTYMLPDVVRAGPPTLSGAPHADWARRLMLLATIATYPGDLSRFGTCGTISWDHGTDLVLGRAWILMNLDGTLRDDMQDKAGEIVTERATRVIDGQCVDREFKREPWKASGVLRLLVDQLRPILDEQRRESPVPTLAGAVPSAKDGEAGQAKEGEPVKDGTAPLASGGAAPSLPPSRERAYRLYEWAIGQDPGPAKQTDDEVYRWLGRRSDTDKTDLPDSSKTFAAYLREARRFYGTSKHNRRQGRNGRSICKADQA